MKKDDRKKEKRTGGLKLRANWKRWLLLYLIMLPGLAYILINNYIPMTGLIIAFKKLDYSVGILRSPWAGIDNFRFLLQTPDAWVITRNTICYNLAFIVIDTIIGIGTAVLLNGVRSKALRTVYQSILLLPYLISMVIVAYLVYAFLSSTTGIINNVIKAFGGKVVNWYMKASAWPVILLIVHAWKSIGFNTVIYTSALVGIGSEYYEAASLDGAGKWKQFTKITLPMLKPTVITLVLLQIGRIFSSDFGLFYQVTMNTGMLAKTTSTIDTYVYNTLMSTGNISMSSAAGFFQSVVGFICIMAANAFVRKVNREQALF